MNLDKYQQLKRTVDDLRRRADRAGGALAQLASRLKDEFGCETFEQAEKMSADLGREAEEAERAFERALGAFEKRWGEVLEGER